MTDNVIDLAAERARRRPEVQWREPAPRTRENLQAFHDEMNRQLRALAMQTALPPLWIEGYQPKPLFVDPVEQLRDTDAWRKIDEQCRAAHPSAWQTASPVRREEVARALAILRDRGDAEGHPRDP